MLTVVQPLSVADLIVVEEAERGAAGARLHDGLVQDLLAARYLADLALSAAAKGADVETLRVRLESIREAASLALAGSRRMMADLTARGTDGVGLAGALRSTAASVLPAATVVTGDDSDSELGELPPATAVTAHRLAGALLRVCASAAPILTVRRDGHTLTLTLDAPVDLDRPEVSGWVTRATALGGSVASGATVHAVLPLDHTSTAPVPEGH